MSYMRFDQMNSGFGPAPASAYEDNYSLMGTVYSPADSMGGYGLMGGASYAAGGMGSIGGASYAMGGAMGGMGGMGGMGAMGGTQMQAEKPPAPVLPNIKNMKDLFRRFGPPDATDKAHGGIAIWSANSLKRAKYGFLHRVEIIDESVPSVAPVKHFSNVYIWTRIKPTCQEQLNNILSLSKDFFYDRKKELLIVRSDSLDTAIAQASLITLYTKGKMSFYDLVNNDMLKQYYVRVLPNAPKNGKVKKALYSILKTTKKMK